MTTDESRLDAMKAMLARFEDDGLEHKRTTRVLYPAPDGRERVLDRADDPSSDKTLQPTT